MKFILLIISILQIICINAYSKGKIESISPYEEVPGYIKNTNSFQREKWFYEQRIYPGNSISSNAYYYAII